MSNTTTNNASALTTSSSLRPRAKRLISGLSEGDESAPDSFDSPPGRIASPIPLPFDSRSASPIPSAHPQRSTRDHEDRYAGNSSWGRRAQLVGGSSQRKAAETSSSLAGIWGSSWSTLQGLASDFLGNDLAPNNGSPKKRSTSTFEGKLRASPASGAWGPAPKASTSHPSSIGGGTKQSREQALRAQKRKDLLTGQDSSYADALGKFKRRTSDEHTESASAPPGEGDDRAALVYVHHVTKNDTLAGITIRYNCSAAVVRKANRMWPNDTVQSRPTIVVPVDACGVKGKPVAGPETQAELDLLGETDDMTAEEVETPKPIGDRAADSSVSRDRTPSMSTTSHRNSMSSNAPGGNAGEPPWHHDSWVLLPGSTQPIEIARLSRRALGYFPPARRKSISLSDLDTPSTSLDLARTVTNTGEPQRPRRPRRLSNANNGYFPAYLAGPGGVGTMSKNVHFPGPAQDGLNKMFAKHLPDVAPPKNQVELYQPEIPHYTDDETPFMSGNVTPSLLPAHTGLENVGGAIEGWVRRFASKTLTPGEHSSSKRNGASLGPRTSVGAPGKGKGGVGDLIEMTDEFEIGGDGDDDDEDDRGRRGYLVQGLGEGASGRDYLGGTAASSRSQSGKGGKRD